MDSKIASSISLDLCQPLSFSNPMSSTKSFKFRDLYWELNCHLSISSVTTVCGIVQLVIVGWSGVVGLSLSGIDLLLEPLPFPIATANRSFTLLLCILVRVCERVGGSE